MEGRAVAEGLYCLSAVWWNLWTRVYYMSVDWHDGCFSCRQWPKDSVKGLLRDGPCNVYLSPIYLLAGAQD